MNLTHKKHKYLKHLLTLTSLASVSGVVGVITSSCYSQSWNWTYADIITLNDYHGYATELDNNPDNMPEIVALAQAWSDLKQENFKNTNSWDSTYMILNGDIAQGTAFSNVCNPSGKSIYDLFKNFQVEYSSVGNHEFDWGQEYLSGKTESGEDHTTFKQMGAFKDFLSCNIFSTKTTTRGSELPDHLVDWVKPWAVKNINGLNVGFVGYTTYETYTTTTVTNLKGLAIADGADNQAFSDRYTSTTKDMSGTKIVQKAVDDCRTQGHADVVFLLAHAGSEFKDKDKTQLDKDSEVCQLVKNTHGIDAVMSAHTHQTYLDHIPNDEGKEIYYAQSGKYGQSYLETEVVFNKFDPKEHFEIKMENHHLGTKEPNNTWIYPKKTDIANITDNFTLSVNRQYEGWQQELAPILNKTQFKLTSTDLDANNHPYIPLKDKANQAGFSPAGEFMAQSAYKVFSKNTLANKSSTDYPTIFKAKEKLTTKWSDFTGVDVAISNIKGVRNNLNASTNTNSEQTAGVNLNDLYNTQPFDNSVYVVKTKVKYFNLYLNGCFYDKGIEQKLLDPFYSEKYMIGYTGEELIPSPKQNNHFFLIDKTTHNKIDENIEIYMLINEFYFKNGDGSEWMTWFNDKENTGVDAIQVAGTYHNEAAFNDYRYMMILAAKVVDKDNPAIVFKGNNVTPGYGFNPSELAFKIN